jgi:hypothetical protein
MRDLTELIDRCLDDPRVVGAEIVRPRLCGAVDVLPTVGIPYERAPSLGQEDLRVVASDGIMDERSASDLQAIGQRGVSAHALRSGRFMAMKIRTRTLELKYRLRQH